MLTQTLKKIIKEQKGQVLPIVLILLVIGGLLIVPTLNYASTSLKGHQVVESKTLELYAADAGIEDALHWLIKGKETGGAWTWNEGEGSRKQYYLNGRFVNVTVKQLEEEGTNIYKITSTATSVDGSTTILSIAWAIPFFGDGTEFNHQNTPPSGDIHVDGDAAISGNIEITGNLTASGSITAINNAKITGNVNIDGDLALNNNSEITGTVCCGGNITLGMGCLITGDIRVGDGSTISLTGSGAGIQGNIWADGNLTIDIDANAEITGDIYAPAGDITIYLRKPNSVIGGNIYASGTINIEVDEGSHGGEYEYYSDGLPFEEPVCPHIPGTAASTLTYEIT